MWEIGHPRRKMVMVEVILQVECQREGREKVCAVVDGFGG